MRKSTVKSLKKKLDILWSKKIRERDEICQHCGKTQSTQAAHIVSRGNLETRWLLENGVGMCYYCHIMWAHHQPIEFTEWIETKLGRAKFVRLKARARIINSWGVKELQKKLLDLSPLENIG